MAIVKTLLVDTIGAVVGLILVFIFVALFFKIGERKHKKGPTHIKVDSTLLTKFITATGMIVKQIEIWSDDEPTATVILRDSNLVYYEIVLKNAKLQLPLGFDSLELTSIPVSNIVADRTDGGILQISIVLRGNLTITGHLSELK